MQEQTLAVKGHNCPVITMTKCECYWDFAHKNPWVLAQ